MNFIKQYISRKYEKKVLNHPTVQKAFADEEMNKSLKAWEEYLGRNS